MAKEMLFNVEAREAVKHGVIKMAKAVKSTLGPKGRSVVIDKSWGAPSITEDGATVADEIELINPYENIGAQMIKHAASKTNDDAGDGTTTCTVLAEAIYLEGLKLVASGANPMALSKGLQYACAKVVEEIKKQSKPVKSNTQIEQIATIAAKNDKEFGKMLAEAMKKVGRDGTITIEEGKGLETEVKVVEGMQFDRGYLSPYFITDPDRMKAELKAPYILVMEDKISSASKLIPLMEKIHAGKKQLVIICEDVEGEALSLMVVNKLKATVNCCAVKAPGFGDRRKEMLGDIAALTGAKALLKDTGDELEKIALTDLGRADKVISDADNTIIAGGKGRPADIAARIAQIRAAIKETDSDYDREKLQERLAKLAGGVAQINVGAATETEMKARKSRVEDSLNAVKAAMAEGTLPGGGVALIRASSALSKVKLSGDEAAAIEILMKALETPARTIADNAGLNGSLAVRDIRKGKGGFGLNAETGNYVDLFKAGVIDPTKVVRSALQNAVSVAALLLTTECVITDEKEKSKAGHGHPHRH